MRNKRRKGIVGIEAAIVLIAFVIVAAALAFVALNMGLFTTQKSKEVISRGLGEASSALEVDGAVTGLTNGTHVYAISIPIKVAPGRQAVDLSPDKTTIRIIAGSTAYENIHAKVYYYYYNSTISAYQLVNPDDSSDVKNISSLSTNTLVSTIWATNPSSPEAVFVILKNVNPDGVLEYGEKAVLLIYLNGTSADNSLEPYDKLIVEIRPPEGATLTVERTMPATLPSAGGAIELG